MPRKILHSLQNVEEDLACFIGVGDGRAFCS